MTDADRAMPASNPTRCEVIALSLGMAVTVCQACGWHQRGVSGMRRRTHCPGCGCPFSVRPARMEGAVVPRVEFIESGQVAEVDEEIYSRAVNDFFDASVSKQDTLFDCIVAAVAKKYGAEAIFSFDKFYQKHGFKLASEL